MAAPRTVQFIALRNLSRVGQQTRKLHMLGARSHGPVRTKQPIVDTAHASITEPLAAASRHFTTSQPQRSAQDTSTIDFFYFPDIDHEVDPATQLIRVPILPDNYNPPRHGAHAPEADLIVHKAEINTMSLDSVILPMSELHDGHAQGVDFHAMADRVAANVRSLKVPVEEQASMMKQLWNDLVDDMLGLKNKKAIA